MELGTGGSSIMACHLGAVELTLGEHIGLMRPTELSDMGRVRERLRNEGYA